jgi:adenylosuccinate lyase
VALEMRETGRSDNDLFDRLAADPRLGLSRDELEDLVTSPIELAGTAPSQVAALFAAVGNIAAKHPEAAGYQPGAIL